MIYQKKKELLNLSLKFFFVVLTAFFLAPTALYAQLFELEVTQTEPDGPIPVFRNFQGKTGLIVKSSQTNLQFDSNLEILDERSNPDEGTYRIIVEPVNQYVRVSAPGFMTSRIHLTGLEPNDVLYYDIEPVTFVNGGEASAEQTFQEIRTTGIEFYNSGDYYFALDRFNDALRLRPDNVEVARYRLNTEDEIAWSEAKLLDTIEAYENYINGTTIKRYSTEAQDAIRNKHISLGETFVANNNIELAEEHLQGYLVNYPSGPEAATAKELLCRLYQNNGDTYAADESFEGQETALDFYNKAASVCISSAELTNKINETEKLHSWYGTPKLSYTMFTHDSRSTYGISFGAIHHFKRGGYFTLRFNEKVFTGGADYTVDASGESIPPRSTGSRLHTGAIREGNAELIIGATYPVYYPAWAYAGVGYAYNPTFWEMENYSSGGNVIEAEWARNTDMSNHGVVFEFGAMAHVIGMNFALGLKGNKISELVPTISIGFIHKTQ